MEVVVNTICKTLVFAMSVYCHMCSLCVYLLVKVDEPDGDLSWCSLVPVDGVAFGQSDHRLELLVVFPLTQRTFKCQGPIRVFIPNYLHVRVSRVTCLDVDLKKQTNKKDRWFLMF